MKELNKRLVVFMDVLGFSNILNTMPTQEVLKVMTSIIGESKNVKFLNIAGSSHTLSSNFDISVNAYDSFFLVSHDLNDETRSAFVLACSHLINIAACKGYFMRGVMDIADVHYDPSLGLILCKEQPKLLDIEKSLEWSGIVLTDRAYSDIHDILDPTHSAVLSYTAPLKASFQGGFKYALNWITTLNLHHPARHNLFELLIEPKRNNTNKFASYALGLNPHKNIQFKDGKMGYASCLKTKTSALCMVCYQDGDNVDPSNIDHHSLKAMFQIS